MNNIIISTLTILLLAVSSISAQQNFDWEGKWEFKLNDNSFCNIHIVTSNLMGNKEPIAIIEGMDNGKAFVAECSVLEIPQRNSVVLMEKADMKGFTYFKAGEPLLVMTTIKPNVKLFWGQLALGANYGMEAGTVEKTRTPHYKGEYAVRYRGVMFSLELSTVKNNQLEANLKSNNVDLGCNCTLRTSHYAICYEQNAKGMFFLDFSDKDVRLINDKNNTAFSANLTPKDKAPIVLNQEPIIEKGS